MIGLDTNVLVRYIMQDDAKQAALATKLIETLTENSPGYISSIVIVELCWVLESAFDLSRDEIVRALQNLIAIDVIKIDRVIVIAASVRDYAASGGSSGNSGNNTKVGIADYLIMRFSTLAGCEKCMTFDKRAAKSTGMTLIN